MLPAAKTQNDANQNTFIRAVATYIVLLLIAAVFGKHPLHVAHYLAILHGMIMGVWWGVQFSPDTETEYVDNDIGSCQRFKADELAIRRYEGKGLLIVGGTTFLCGVIAVWVF